MAGENREGVSARETGTARQRLKAIKPEATVTHPFFFIVISLLD
jgi:hypothetical protein